MTEVFWQRKVRQNCYKPLRSPKKPPTIKQKSNLVLRVWQSSQNFISCLRSVCYILLWLFVESANKKERVYNTPLDIIYIVRQNGMGTGGVCLLVLLVVFKLGSWLGAMCTAHRCGLKTNATMLLVCGLLCFEKPWFASRFRWGSVPSAVSKNDGLGLALLCKVFSVQRNIEMRIC